MLTKAQRKRLVDLIENGVVSIADVAEHTSTSPQAVRRWIDPAKAREAHRQLSALIIEAALNPPTLEHDAAIRNQQRKDIMRIVSQRNPMKGKVLSMLRRKKITIPTAARRAGVPISAIVGWCRLHKIALPTEYENYTHRQPPGIVDAIKAASPARNPSSATIPDSSP